VVAVVEPAEAEEEKEKDTVSVDCSVGRRFTGNAMILLENLLYVVRIPKNM
jgi:hypothetical protein